MKKLLSVILAMVLMLSMGTTAFALSSQKTATEEIANFLGNPTICISKLNEVANQNVDAENKLTMYDGSTVLTEIRNLKIDSNLSIVNTRTYTTKGSTHTIDDSYGLFWGGVAGAGGTLTAKYVYSNPQMIDPNYMTTKIENASGYARNLDSSYDLISTDPRWDTGESYSASAEVTFNMEIGFSDVYYTHSCQFDNYGDASMSWF